MDPLLSSQMLYSTADSAPHLTGNKLNNRITGLISGAFSDSQEPSQKTHATFLHKRLKHFSLSVGDQSFTLEDFLSNPAIREKVFSEIQKIIVSTIKTLAADILIEIRNAGNPKTAKKLAKRGDYLLKAIKEYNKIKDVESKALKDFHAFFSFGAKLNLPSLFSNISNISDKWNRGEVKIDLKDFLKHYCSFHNFVDVSYDAFSFLEDTVGLFDDNMFIKMFYEAAGYGKEFTPFASEFILNISIANSLLAPARLYLKGSKVFKYMTYDENKIEKDPLKHKKKLVNVKRELLGASLDLTRETIKTGANILIFTGIIASNPLTAFVTILSITSLSMKIYGEFNKSKKPPKKISPQPEHLQPSENRPSKSRP
jgi:hypothetical protein